MALEGTKPPRAGEALDEARVAPWLRELVGAPSAEVRIGQFPGGHSNLTYAALVGDLELVLRRPPFGTKAKSAHDMGREWRVLSAIAPHFRWAPRPIAYAPDDAQVGSPMLVMERVPGTILRREAPAGADFGEAVARRLAASFVEVLAALHAIDYRAAGLEGFGKPEGYVARQVQGWTERYAKARTDDLADVDKVAAWLAANQPPEGGACVLHNDYKLDNLVLEPGDLGAIRGVLDWEMSAVGDPLMDLGTALSYWVEAGDPDEYQFFRFGPTHVPGMPTRRELVLAYEARTGRDARNIAFYAAFGLFKTAVVAQQIYYRYKAGQTKDERFAIFIEAVRLLSARAARTIETGEV